MNGYVIIGLVIFAVALVFRVNYGLAYKKLLQASAPFDSSESRQCRKRITICAVISAAGIVMAIYCVGL